MEYTFNEDDKGFNEARNTLARNRGLYEMIDDPRYAEMLPELLTNESANYELAQENPLLKSAQMGALAKMAGLAETGLSEADEAGFVRARNLAGQVSRGGQAAALQNAASRGVAGSGLEFAMKEAANQEAAQRAQESGLAQAAESARNKALYQTAYGNALAGVRGQDQNMSQSNAGIINRFNEMNTQGRNATNAANANARNQAFQYNQGLQDKKFQNQLTRADRTAGFNNQAAQIAAANEEQKRARDRANSGAMFGTIGAIVGGAYGGAGGASAGASVGQNLGAAYG